MNYLLSFASGVCTGNGLPKTLAEACRQAIARCESLQESANLLDDSFKVVAVIKRGTDGRYISVAT